MAAPDDLAAYLDWCAQEADGEVPPLSYREWQEAREAMAEDAGILVWPQIAS